MFNWNYLNAIVDEKRAEWAGSGPTKYVVIDDFLDPEVCRELFNLQGVQKKLENANARTHKHVRGKSGTPNKALMTERQREFFDKVNSDEFVDYVKNVTGISSLYADDDLAGGGLHLTRPGGYLNVHTDFNFQPSTLRHRKLNLLLYLNPEWKEEWNGHIELWDKEIERPFVRLAPIFNRVLMFETSEDSYHGHPDPLRTPPGTFRVSLAVYYYSDWPEGLEQRAQTGYQLTRKQWSGLMRRIADVQIKNPGATDDDVVRALEVDYQTRDIRQAYCALRDMATEQARSGYDASKWAELADVLANCLYERDLNIEEAVTNFEDQYEPENIRTAFRILKSLRSARLTGERYWEYPDGRCSLQGPEKVA